MATITIKQANQYFDYTGEESEFEEYDRRLIYCVCEKICEIGVGICDNCCNEISLRLSDCLDEDLNVG